MASSKKVTLAQIQHFLLSKHGLVSRLSSYDSSSMLPLHATNTTTPYLSLLARINNFGEGEDEEKEKEGWKQILHSPSSPSFSLQRCMRGTLHLIPRNLVAVVGSLYSESFVEEGDNNKKRKREDDDEEEVEEEQEEDETTKNTITTNSKILKFHKIPQDEADALAVHILAAIKTHGPQNAVSIKKHIPADLIKVRKDKWSTTSNIGPVMKYLYQAGKLEYGVSAMAAPPAKKTKKETKKKETKKKNENKLWRSSVRLFGLAPEQSNLMEKEPAMVELAKWYFKLYAPAAFEDFVWWTGLNTTPCKKAFDSIKSELVAVKSDGIDEKMYIYKNELENLCKSPNKAPSMARLLPYEDALLKAYKTTRHRFFGNGNTNKIITTDGVANPTVWLDGSVVGVWQWTNKPGQNIKISLFESSESESEKETKGKGKGKGKVKEDSKDTLRQRLKEEIELVGKFVEYNSVVWD